MFLDKLDWRYAVKKMDPTQPAPADKVAKIVEAVRMAPSSSGVQPYELFVISNTELREKIRPAAYDQAQITEGSHLLVFAAWDNYTEERMAALTALVAQERGGLTDTIEAYYDRLKGMLLSRPAEVNHEHAARQAYIGLGFALAAAAELEVDSTPMEGFDPSQLDEILALKDKGLKSVVVLALGTRDASADWLMPLKKVRRSKADMITEID